jgi:hypothetical protein
MVSVADVRITVERSNILPRSRFDTESGATRSADRRVVPEPYHVAAVGNGGAERRQHARRRVTDVGQRGDGLVACGGGLGVGGGGVDGGANAIDGVAKRGQVGRQLVVEGVDAAGFGVVDRRGECGDHGFQALCEFRFDEPAHAAVGGAKRASGQLAGGDAGDPVDEFVRLVDDEQVVLGQHVDVGDGIDGEQRVVRHDDIGVTRLVAGLLGEAVGSERTAAGAEAFAGGHTDLAPRPVGHTRHDFVAVAGFGVRCPFREALHVAADGRRRHRVE